VDNLLDGVTGDLAPTQREYLDSVRASAGHLNRLITNLLEITRMEKDGIRVADDVLDLVAVFRRAAATAGPLAMEKRVRIEIEAPTGGLPARGDADKLTEVALNLLDNAVKYAPAGTRIHVSCRVAGGRPTVTVRDQGAGLGDAETASLFGRFSQGPPSAHSPKQGFGLGLYIVDSYLRMMGGEIHAVDHSEGGAMFTCCLRAPESPVSGKERQ
jgi:signal transduction histidine kinase